VKDVKYLSYGCTELLKEELKLKVVKLFKLPLFNSNKSNTVSSIGDRSNKSWF